MNRQFWGVAARGVLPELATLPPGSVYSHDASPAWGWYRRLGLLPNPDWLLGWIRGVPAWAWYQRTLERLPRGYPDSGQEVGGINASKYALVIHELHFNRHDYLIWKAYGTVRPVFVLRSDGVPIVSLYRRP